MKEYYFHIFFGEVHPFQVRAESYEVAIDRAFQHLKEEEGLDFTPVKLLDTIETTRNYLDNQNMILSVGLYDGDKPWHVKVASKPGDFITGGPIETEPERTDYSNLAKMAIVIDMETGTVVDNWDAA